MHMKTAWLTIALLATAAVSLTPSAAADGPEGCPFGYNPDADLNVCLEPRTVDTPSVVLDCFYIGYFCVPIVAVGPPESHEIPCPYVDTQGNPILWCTA